VTGYIELLMDVLSIDFTLGTVTMNLGGIALGSILISAGVGFFRKLGGRR